MQINSSYYQGLLDQFEGSVDSFEHLHAYESAYANELELSPLLKELQLESVKGVEGLSLFHQQLGHYPVLTRQEEQYLFIHLYKATNQQVIQLLQSSKGRALIRFITGLAVNHSLTKSSITTDSEYYAMRREVIDLRGDKAQSEKLKQLLPLLQDEESLNKAFINPALESLTESIVWPAALVTAISRFICQIAEGGGDLDKALNAFIKQSHCVDHKSRLAIAPEMLAGILKSYDDYFRYREILITRNLRLVYTISKRYAAEQLPMLDLIQEGVFGLVRAIEKYQLSSGFKFSTYAYRWIESKVRLVKETVYTPFRIPTHINTELSRLHRTSAEMTAANEPVNAATLSERLNMDKKHVESLQAINTRAFSMDSRMGDGSEDLTLGGMLGEGDEEAQASVARQELGEGISWVLSQLSERDAFIISQYYGLNGIEPQSNQAIADQLGLSRERVRQIHRGALLKLTDMLSDTEAGEQLMDLIR